MATKAELARTLNRTQELARNAGLLHFTQDLVLGEADRETGIPWSVVLTDLRHDGKTFHHSGALPFLPDSGHNIGWTKREAQETLRTVNGVLNTIAAQKRYQSR